MANRSRKIARADRIINSTARDRLLPSFSECHLERFISPSRLVNFAPEALGSKRARFKNKLSSRNKAR